MSINAYKIIISVVVCTLNRSQLLRKCLESLANQQDIVEQYEVIVVDNGSIDDTDAVIQEFINSHENFRNFKEIHLGLSHARNRGWREAEGEYVAYIDDDAEAFPNWLEEIFAFIHRHPEQVAFGGPYEVFSTVSVPDWFPPEYGSKSWGNEERVLNLHNEFISGTNMVFKLTALKEAGGFCPELGMIGETISYGEETRLQLSLSELGYQIYYVPQMKVRHYLAPYKMHLRWLLASVFAHGYSSGMLSDHKRTLFSHFRGLVYGSYFAVRTLFECPYTPAKRKIYLSLVPLVSEWGAFCCFLRNRYIGNKDVGFTD